MGKPMPMDLRSRALAAVYEGMSCRAAARRFGVVVTVIRWPDQRRITGGYAAKAQSVDTRSHRIEAHAPTSFFLPPYWPEFNSIGKLVDLFQPQECANYFSSCGYDPE